MARRLVACALILAAATGGTAVLLLAGDEARCAAAYRPATPEELEEHGLDAPHGGCVKRGEKLPEHPDELLAVHESVDQRLGADDPRAYPRAVRARKRLLRQASTVPGTSGTWTPLGKGPLIANDPEYRETFGSGYGRLAGRVSDLAYDPEGKRLFAAAGPGGVWMSEDAGRSWRSIADNLPTQVVGALGWSPADGGTLIVLTGDSTFSGFTYGGFGAFRTTDLGRTWDKAAGAPDGALGFRVAVDPSEPRTIYLATGFGLFRSTDAGRTYADVKLPTGGCAGNSLKAGCYLANVVTDVVVQGRDGFGHAGGAVLAAVGWRGGRTEGAGGVPQAPANGLYRSATGAPGTFAKPAATGFTAPARIGRVALGNGNGPGQNTGFVYAAVQDAVLYENGKIAGLDVEGPSNPLTGNPINATPTLLDGIYVSPDFGDTWLPMVTGLELQTPTTGSHLAQLPGFAFGPGIIAWYSMWIAPDPYSQVGGIPTRVSFGLEEVWDSLTAGVPQAAKGVFGVVGPYTATAGACIVVLVAPTCADKQSLTPDLYTTHPDQHAGLFIPGTGGGSTLVVGHDGGVNTQAVPAVGPLTQAGWSAGENEGFSTLYPYGVSISRDGTVFGGLQDNGALKIDPDGTQRSVRGADGVFALVDPHDSKVAYEETQEGGLAKTVDGGRTWEAIAPTALTGAAFVTPLVMDPTDPKHLVIAGRNVFETKVGRESTSSTWTSLYDLGTRGSPGRAGAVATDADPDNQASAAAVHGRTIYVGYCGACNPVDHPTSHRTGLATNAGGRWHLAKAEGLPERTVTSLAIDPDNPLEVVATLGRSTRVSWLPPGGGLEPDPETRGGAVFRSTDGGETFRDVSGDLPAAGAAWVLLRGRQLVVATSTGVYASTDRDGTRFGLLGTTLPAAPVFSLATDPSHANKIIAAVYGRGVWSYEFRNPPAVGCTDTQAPTVRVKRSRARLTRRGGLRLQGTSADRGCGRQGRGTVRRVEVALARVSGDRCRHLDRRARSSERRACTRRRWQIAKNVTRWTFSLKRRIPAGRYHAWVRAKDRAGNAGRAARLTFRVR